MPSFVCPASWCEQVGSWCSACWLGIRISRCCSVCWTCYGVEASRLEVGVWMLRSVLASGAVAQQGEWAMSEAKRGATSTARPGAGQRRCVVVNQEIDALRTRNLRLFKAYLKTSDC